MLKTIGICLLGYSFSCGALAQQPKVVDLRARFLTQVRASAAQGFSYVKTVTEGNEAARQTLRYTVSQGASHPVMTADHGTGNFADELAYAVEYLYTDPALKSYFLVTNRQDTVLAVLKDEYRDKCDLKVQRVVQGLDGTLRYLESNLSRSSLLYDTDIAIGVLFTPAGLYERHELGFSTRIILGFKSNPTHIIGKAEPNPISKTE